LVGSEAEAMLMNMLGLMLEGMLWGLPLAIIFWWAWVGLGDVGTHKQRGIS
jgi:hypothetical protein